MLLFLSLMALSSLPLWHEQKLLFLRERAAGAYGTGPYFAAVVSCLLYTKNVGSLKVECISITLLSIVYSCE